MQGTDDGKTNAVPQAGFALVFQGKYKLSMMVTPRRQYLTGSKASPKVSFTTAPEQAMVFALYFVMESGGGASQGVILQVTPTDGDAARPGGFISVAGRDGDVFALNAFDASQATVFEPEFLPGPRVRLRHRTAGRHLMARTPKGDQEMTLWLPPLGRYDDEPWQLDPILVWDYQTMEGKDLRYVQGLRYRCWDARKLSFKAAQLQYADFSGARLVECDFTKANCEGASFEDATLQASNFTSAAIKGANFSGMAANKTKFPGVDFSEAIFNRSVAKRSPSFEEAILTGAIFTGCSLDRCSFKGAKLAGAHFDKASLLDADLSGADLAGATLEEADAQCAKFVKSPMTGATLKKAKLAGASFEEAILTKASFEDAKFSSTKSSAPLVDFTRATLYEIDFSGCDLRQAKITGRPDFHQQKDKAVPSDATGRAKFCRATVPLSVIGDKTWRMLDLSGATIIGQLSTMENFHAEYTIFPYKFALPEKIELTGAKFNGATMVGIKLIGATSIADLEKIETIPDFTDADLQDADLSGASLENAYFKRAIMRGINLTNAQLSYAKFESARLDTVKGEKDGVRRADLSYANLTGADFSQAYLDKGIETDGANLSYVVFYGDKATVREATLNGSTFSNAYLAGVDFSSAKAMQNINFAGACLVNCIFNNASLQGAKLNGAYLLGAKFEEANLSGASMSHAVLADTPPSGTKYKLTVKGIYSRPRTLDYGATLISGNATNDQTTCPSGKKGPCDESAWQRVSGDQEWEYKKKS